MIRPKTVYYAFDTLTSSLATNTTLGTATRHNFAAITLTLPETGSRTFRSVRAIVSCRDAFTVAGTEVTGWRLGIKLGAVAFADTDRSFTQADTGNALFDEVDLDVTDYFNTNFGGAATQTCQVGFAVSTDVAANVNAITCLLEITYDFDDDVGTTRVKSIPIPLQSVFGQLTAVQAEVGTEVSGGANGAPANQIPALSTYLEEASVSIKRAWFEIDTQVAESGATDLTLFAQIDATAEQTGPTWEGAIGNDAPIRWLLPYDTATHSTASSHAFKMRADVTGRANSPRAVLWVTYTYNKATTTRILNVIEVPMRDPALRDGVSHYTVSPTSNVAADACMYVGDFEICEPGAITLKQSGISCQYNVRSGAPNVKLSCGAQPYREYGPTSTASLVPFFHRADHSSGWSIARGRNRVAMSMYSVAVLRSTITARAFVVYSSAVPSAGTEAGSRVVSFLNSSFYGGALASSVLVAASGAGQRTPTLGSTYRLQSVSAELRVRCATSQMFSTALYLGVDAGELDGATLMPVGPGQAVLTPFPIAELQTIAFSIPMLELFNRDTLHAGRLDIETARRLAFQQGGVAANFSLCTRICLHQCTFVVAASVTIDGVAPPDGKTVEIWAVDPSTGEAELVTTALTTGGTGAFSATVLDDWRSYHPTYSNDGNYGRGASGTPV